MAVTVRATAVSGAGASPRVVAKPTGTQAGDLLVLQICMTVSNAEFTVPSGFDEVLGAQVIGPPTLHIYTKLATAAEPDSYTVTFVGTSSSRQVAMTALAAGEGYVPTLDVVAAQFNTTTDRIFPSVDTTVANTLFCMFASANNVSSTPPGDCAEHYDTGSARVYFMSKAFASAGSTGSHTATGTDTSNAAASLAFYEGEPPEPTYPEVRATQAGMITTIEGEGLRATQMGAIITLGPIGLRVSQLGLIVAMDPTEAVPYAREIGWELFVDWDRDGEYDDESLRLISARGQSNLAPPEGVITSPQGIVDECTLTLWNGDEHLGALNEAADLYAAMAGGGIYQAPFYLNVLIDGQSYRLITGVIKNPTEQVRAVGRGQNVTLDCRSRDDLMLQKRMHSTRAQFVQFADQGVSEEEVLAAWLTGAGLVDGVDFVSQAYAEANPETPATLDRGLFIIPYPWLDGESVLEECWALAAACCGLFYADRYGVYRYENMQHWLLDAATPMALDSGSWVSWQFGYNDRELYSAITVEMSKRELDGPDVVWEPDAPVTVNPGESEVVNARLNSPLYTLDGVYWQAMTSGGVDISASVTLDIVEYAQRLELTFTNNHATHMAFLRGLRVEGQAIVSARAEEVEFVSEHAFWTERIGRNRSIRANPYVQTMGQAKLMGAFLRDRHQTPRLFGSLNNVGTPEVWVGDRVRLTEEFGLSSLKEFFVLGVTWTITQNGYTQDASIVDADGLYPYQDASPGYFIIGTNTLGSGSSAPGRLFY